MMIGLILICISGLLGAGTLLVIYGTIAKNKWGLNLRPISCPRCNTPLSMIRRPQNIRQTLWGGWTCSNCGTEVDKWGREVLQQKYGHLQGIQPR
jgi:DNA-directed RNA polymerase subunit RPC12/RpoP